MREKVSGLVFGRDTIISGVFAVAIVTAVGLGCTCGKQFDIGKIAKNANIASMSDNDNGSSEMPDDRLLAALVKETTVDFALAVSTEDFSQIYEKSSADFRNTYTLKEMNDTFRPFISRKKQVLPILAKAVAVEPEFSPAPSLRSEQGLSILTARGKFATTPLPVTFEYEYVRRDGKWKMLKLVVKIV